MPRGCWIWEQDALYCGDSLEEFDMSTKSRWFLVAACAAMLVALARTLPGVWVSNDVSDFFAGLAAGLMVGVLVTWRDR